MFKNIYIGVIILFLSPSLWAQETSFKAAVNKNRLGLNERLRITFTINKQGGDNFTPPNFKNFKVLAGPMQATSFSSFNGKKSFEMAYSYVLEPKRKGALTIPSASIEIDGNTIVSNTLKVTVTDAIEIPEDPNDPKYIASQNIHLVAEVSNSSPYVGESISVVYKIFVDVNRVNVRNYRETTSPSFNGFWNQNIEVNQADSKESTFQGKTHRYAVLRKVVLIPQKSGKLTISPLEMEIGAGVPTGRRGMFGVISKDINFTATTGERTINVKPLPSENKPIDFSGAVGDFDFRVFTNKNRLKANDAAQIRVEVSGKGNLKMVVLPQIETPAGLEKYDPEHKENISTSLGGFRGSIYDEYTVVPQYRGKYKIPPTTFSYFSLKDKTYKTITSDAVIIDAPEGKIAAGENIVANNNKKNVVANAKDIRFIKINANLIPQSNAKDFFKSTRFYLLLILPLLSIPIGIIVGIKKQKRDGDVVGNKRRKADKLTKKYLSEAKKQLGHKENFYEALEKALHNYLKAKLQVETSDISKDKIRELLEKRNVNADTINNFINVFDSCDYARYTPTTNVMMQQEYETARKVIVKIDKQL